jgi:hypothetical protein
MSDPPEDELDDARDLARARGRCGGGPVPAEPRRPPILYLYGGATGCCGGSLLVLCDGAYKCPCGKVHTRRANRILGEMADLF